MDHFISIETHGLAKSKNYEENFNQLQLFILIAKTNIPIFLKVYTQKD